MSFAKLGSLIQVVPYPVTIGFTSGIGLVIAALQLKDFFGLSNIDSDGHFIPQIAAAINGMPHLQPQDTIIGIITLFPLIFWSKLKSKIPSHLVGLFMGSIVAALLGYLIDGFEVQTIASRFSYNIEGKTFAGIPPLLPTFDFPWNLPDQNGAPIGLSFSLLKSLLGPAFAIAILGALESLLCAVVADSMSGTKHNPNDELLGQGIGNLIVPFFGAIPATAALARTAVNIRAGATSPISSVFHSIFLIAAILLIAPLLGYIPMASLAALLLIVAWNMSEVSHFSRILKVAPRGDICTMLTCFSLTVLLDMEIAIAVGMALAGLLFIRRSIELTEAKLVKHNTEEHQQNLNKGILIYDIDGPLFFGTAQKALSELTRLQKEISIIILDFHDVPIMDMTGIVALESIVDNLSKQKVRLFIVGASPRIISKLNRAGICEREGQLEFSVTLESAIERA